MYNKISISLLCLNNLNQLDAFLQILKTEKIKFIELPISKISRNFNFNKQKFIKIKKKFKKNSIKVSSIQSIFFNKNNWNIFDIKKHKVILNHLIKVFKIAKYFESKNIIFGSPKNRYFYKNNNKENAINFFQKVKLIAAKFNINFCIEPNAKYYNCNYINTVDEAVGLVKLISHKNFLINVDTGNIFLEKDNCLSAKHNQNLFANFQISEKNLTNLSKSKINHFKILKKFKIKNKFISLEMLNTDIQNLHQEILLFKKIVTKI
jgi:sugar phosphate isomerase/epimerase